MKTFLYHSVDPEAYFVYSIGMMVYCTHINLLIYCRLVYAAIFMVNS